MLRLPGMEQRDPLTEQIIGCAIECMSVSTNRTWLSKGRWWSNFNRTVLSDGIKRFIL